MRLLTQDKVAYIEAVVAVSPRPNPVCAVALSQCCLAGTLLFLLNYP